MYLRRRFVLGASEYMAGANGSKQNDKALFEYTDDEWEFIWMSMLEDGAWAVPSIKDDEGKTVKANFAPEILIKFIAHDIRCHIVVFDLLLNTVQFLSGNHVKTDNVEFESPLLIYSTGCHFQSVLPADHEYFINYARTLEAEIDGGYVSVSNSPKNHGTEIGKTNQKPKECPSTSYKPPFPKQNKSSDGETTNSRLSTKAEDPEERIISEGFRKRVKSNSGDNENQYQDIEPEIERIKSIKAKDRTTEERRQLDRYRKRISRKTCDKGNATENQNITSNQNESEEMQNARKKRDRERKQDHIQNETEEMRKRRQQKDLEQKKEHFQKEREEMHKSRQEANNGPSPE